MAMYTLVVYGHSKAPSQHGNQQIIISIDIPALTTLYLRSVDVCRDHKDMPTHFQTQKQFCSVVGVSCGMEQWGGLREGLAACSGTIFCQWIQIAPVSCLLLSPLEWTAPGCRHVAPLDNDINNLSRTDSMNQCIGDPWKKEVHSNANMTNPLSLCAVLGDQKVVGN